ncbi:hypothetical protein SpCBS45565_g08263 [Spizellomyces sp. 'palustris']|nr:hypothetical protein SpCBS45565_g08263 [Spizellomyces sp. 'palustris']
MNRRLEPYRDAPRERPVHSARHRPESQYGQRPAIERPFEYDEDDLQRRHRRSLPNESHLRDGALERPLAHRESEPGRLDVDYARSFSGGRMGDVGRYGAPAGRNDVEFGRSNDRAVPAMFREGAEREFTSPAAASAHQREHDSGYSRGYPSSSYRDPRDVDHGREPYRYREPAGGTLLRDTRDVRIFPPRRPSLELKPRDFPVGHPERESRYRDYPQPFPDARTRPAASDVINSFREYPPPWDRTEILEDTRGWSRNEVQDLERHERWDDYRGDKFGGHRSMADLPEHGRDIRPDVEREREAAFRGYIRERSQSHRFQSHPASIREAHNDPPSSELDKHLPLTPNTNYRSGTDFRSVRPSPYHPRTETTVSPGSAHDIWQATERTPFASKGLSDRSQEGSLRGEIGVRSGFIGPPPKIYDPSSEKADDKTDPGLTSPHSANPAWQKPTSENRFSYFSREVPGAFPDRLQPRRADKGAEQSEAEEASLPSDRHAVEETVSSVITPDTPSAPRKASLNESSQSLERLARLEDEIAEYKELLALVKEEAGTKRDDNVAGPNIKTENDDETAWESDAHQRSSSPAANEDGMEVDFSVEENDGESVSDGEVGEGDTDKELQLWERITRKNRRRARHVRKYMSKRTDAKVFYLPIKSLYTEPCDYNFYLPNTEIHATMRGLLSQKIFRRFSQNGEKRGSLRQEYKERLEEWRRTSEQIDQDEARKKKKLGKTGGTMLGNTSTTVTFAATGSGSNAGGLYTRGSRRTATFTSDTVRTEAEFQYALALLGNVDDDPTDHDPARSAVEPPMVVDPLQRKLLCFRNYNDLVYDPVRDLERYNARLTMTWTDTEQRIFKEKILQYGKNFHSISAHLPHKTSRQCVDYYYREKNHLNLKHAIKRAMSRAKRRAAAARKAGKEIGTEGPSYLLHPTGSASAKDSPTSAGGRRGGGRPKEAPPGRVIKMADETTGDNGRRGSRSRIRLDGQEIPGDQSDTEDASKRRKGPPSTKVMHSGEVTELGSGRAFEKSRKEVVFEITPDAGKYDTPDVTRTPATTHHKTKGRTVSAADLESPDVIEADDNTTDRGVEDIGEASPYGSLDSPVPSPRTALKGLAQNEDVAFSDMKQRKRHARRRETEDTAKSSSGDLLDADVVDVGRSSPQPKRTISYWNSEETVAFKDAYKEYGTNWELVARHVGSKSAKQAQNYYKKNQLELDRLLEETRARSMDAFKVDALGSRSYFTARHRLLHESVQRGSPAILDMSPPSFQRVADMLSLDDSSEDAQEPVIRRTKTGGLLDAVPKTTNIHLKTSGSMDNIDDVATQLDIKAEVMLQSMSLSDHVPLAPVYYHPSLTRENRPHPQQAAAAAAAQRVAKAVQHSVHPYVENFVRMQRQQVPPTSPSSSTHTVPVPQATTSGSQLGNIGNIAITRFLRPFASE